MIRGEKVLLRAITREDVPLLHTWEHDHEEWALGTARPYVPVLEGDEVARFDKGEIWKVTDTVVPFAAEADGVLLGHAALWGIDLHNRRAHLGIGFGPHARGKGYGADACRTLLRYAFEDRGLHRLQLEVLADNTPAIRAYLAAGFVEEGRLREAAWVRGRFVDELIMSVVAPRG